MLGSGQSVDLFKLYWLVREKGGYDVVTENGLWNSVAKESGLDPGIASSLKLIFPRYLDALHQWLQRNVKDKDSKVGLVNNGTNHRELNLDSESKVVSSEISDKKKDEDRMHLDLEESRKLCTGGEVLRFVELDDGRGNGSTKHIELSVVGEGGFHQKKCTENEVQCFMKAVGDKGNDNDKRRVDGGKCETEFGSVVKEDWCNRKRKRGCYSALLDWVTTFAKDPCNPAIGSLPERSKWKSCGNEQLWKQVLLAREVMLLKRNADSSAEQFIWQKRQKTHPTMYEDHSGLEKSRCSQRIISSKESRAVLFFNNSEAQVSSESSSSGDFEDHFDKKSNPRSVNPLIGLWINNHSRKRIPVGSFFQAKVPKWTGETCESDSKWLGTHSWQQERGENCNDLIERDCIGFGRHDLCSCEFPGSFECVKFHVAEKRIRVKLELGLAFYHWQIDKMGEGVALSWGLAEEKKFKAIVRSNPPTQDECFWDEIYKLFPYKSLEQLVSYYFNVFLLRRRGHQNRSTPTEIDSDYDEPEIGSTTDCIKQGSLKPPGSIYCSPKKAHLNFIEPVIFRTSERVVIRLYVNK